MSGLQPRASKVSLVRDLPCRHVYMHQHQHQLNQTTGEIGGQHQLTSARHVYVLAKDDS